MPVELNKLQNKWARFWMRFAGTGMLGRVATRFASWNSPEYYGRHYLARYNQKGYISPSASVAHNSLKLGCHVFIDDRVMIYADENSGSVELGDKVSIYRDSILQTGDGGNITIGPKTAIQPRCQFSAYKGSIQIGAGVQIAPNCSFYPYDHGIKANELMSAQPSKTKGGIVVGDDAWLGVGVIVLDGVNIGKGAVIAAGAVVTTNIPDGAIAVGVPARVVKMRE